MCAKVVDHLEMATRSCLVCTVGCAVESMISQISHQFEMAVAGCPIRAMRRTVNSMRP